MLSIRLALNYNKEPHANMIVLYKKITQPCCADRGIESFAVFGGGFISGSLVNQYDRCKAACLKGRQFFAQFGLINCYGPVQEELAQKHSCAVGVWAEADWQGPL